MSSMETRTLQHTDLTVSRAAFGTMPFGTQADEAHCRRMVDCCMDHGINFFDTADVYNNGVAETVLGNVLKGRRDRVVLASKVGFPTSDAPDRPRLSRAEILGAIDGSLTRLQTDYVDLYYLHVPDWNVPLEESLEAMDRLVRAGKVRYPACSNYAGWQVVQMLWIGEKSGYKPPYVSQPMYNLLARGIEQEYLAMCKQFGVSTVVYNPLAGGLLTGKQPRREPVAGTRFDKNQLYLDRYWHPGYFDAVEELRAAAEKERRSLVDVSLSWLLRHTATDCIILGASKLEQLEQNLTAFEKGGPLSAELLAVCERVWQNLRGITPKYNR
jgi:aryl-alcohol dehydrogenase-like predicted oxidoreductase